MTNEEKCKFVRDAVKILLESQDTSKIKDYFHKDLRMILNTTELNFAELIKRLDWIRENIRNVRVNVIDVICQSDTGFDYHTTEFTDLEGNVSLYKIYGYIKFKEDKICLYEDVTIQLKGKEAMNAIDAITA